jgi:acyl-CoA thioester hydrolase
MEQCPAMSPADRPRPLPRSHYPALRTLSTRWMDNDVYGHVNNVVYYSFFDTAVNAHLIEAGALDIEHGSVIGLVVETHCNYYAPLAFPQAVDAGLRVARIGHSSVRYELGLFGAGQPLTAAAGHFVHVYVDRATRRPVAALPTALRAALQRLCPPPETA